MKRLTIIFSIGILYFVTSCTPTPKHSLNFAYTGEIHGTLLPDSLTGEGGTAKIAVIVDSLKQQDSTLLMFDAGGFMPGGKYDRNTLGSVLDNQRAKIMLSAMEKVAYDAVAVGDDDLVYFEQLLEKANSIPFTCANLKGRLSHETIFSPYKIIERDGSKIAVIGLLTTEIQKNEFRSGLDSCKITDPMDELKTLIVKLKPEVQGIIVLSHLGEKLSKTIAQNHPEVWAVVNAHRKDEAVKHQRINSIPFFQFTYLATNLGIVNLQIEKNQITDYNYREVYVARNRTSNPEIDQLLKEFDTFIQDRGYTHQQVKLDLFTMGYCPFCFEIDAIVNQIQKEMGSLVQLNRRSIVEISSNGSLTSSHGEKELFEEKLQKAVLGFSSDNWSEFIACRKQTNWDSTWQICAAKIGLDSNYVLTQANSAFTEAELYEDADYVERWLVEGSPTLYINNKIYTGNHDKAAIEKEICNKLFKPTSVCQKLPVCFSDADCVKPGYTGKCIKPGAADAICGFNLVQNLYMIVVDDTNRLFSPYTRLKSNTDMLFPGMLTKYFPPESVEGKSYIDQFKPKALPLIIFGAGVEKENNYPRVESILEKYDTCFVLKPSSTGSIYLLEQTPKPKQIDFIFSPIIPSQVEWVINLKKNLPQDWKIVLHGPIASSQDSIVSINGRAELEIVSILLTIQQYWPEKLWEYISHYYTNVGSIFWEIPIEDAKIPVKKLKSLLSSDKTLTLLEEEVKYLESLQMFDEIMLVKEGVEVYRPHDKTDLDTYLQQMLEQIK